MILGLKQIIITHSIWLLCYFSCAAQNGGKKTTLYFLAGPSYLTIRGMPYSHNFVQKGPTRLGYQFGLGLTHHLGRRIFLNTRLLLERSRFQVNYVDYDSTNKLIGESKQDFSKYYVTLCVIPQFRLSKYFNVGMGFYVGKLLKSTVDIQSHNLVVFGSSLNQIGQSDQGLAVTGGVTIPYNRLIFTLQIAANYGLQNVTTAPASSWYFNTYSALFGIRYKIK